MCSILSCFHHFVLSLRMNRPTITVLSRCNVHVAFSFEPVLAVLCSRSKYCILLKTHILYTFVLFTCNFIVDSQQTKQSRLHHSHHRVLCTFALRGLQCKSAGRRLLAKWGHKTRVHGQSAPCWRVSRMQRGNIPIQPVR